MEKDNIEIKKRGGEAGAMHSERGNKMKVTRNGRVKYGDEEEMRQIGMGRKQKTIKERSPKRGEEGSPRNPGVSSVSFFI